MFGVGVVGDVSSRLTFLSFWGFFVGRGLASFSRFLPCGSYLRLCFSAFSRLWGAVRVGWLRCFQLPCPA